MTAELAGGLGAVGLFAVPGFALTELVPGLRAKPPARRAAYGYLLGVTTVAGALYVLSHTLGVPLRPPAVWTAAALPVLAGLAAALLRRRAARRPAARARERAAAAARRPHGLRAWIERLGGWTAAACVLGAALSCCGIFAEALTNPIHDWDGRMTWGAQARYVRDAGSVDAPVLRDARWFITHPQYPLLLPVAQVAALEAFAADPEAHLPRAIYAAFFPALLLVIYDGARRCAGPLTAALVVLAASAAPFFVRGEGGAESTYSDLPLACFYGAALVVLLAPRPRPGDGWLAGVFLAAAVLAKNEGSALAALALLLGWRAAVSPAPLSARRDAPAASLHDAPAASLHQAPEASREVPAVSRRRPALLRFAAATLPLLLALAFFASWRAGIPNRQDENYPDLLRAGGLWPGVVTHVAEFAPVLVDRMAIFKHWVGFWFMVPAVLLAGRRAFRHPRNRRLALAAAGPPAIAWAAYSIHARPAYLAEVTWERFLLQAAVPLFILLACALAELRRHIRGSGFRRAARLPGTAAPT